MLTKRQDELKAVMGSYVRLPNARTPMQEKAMLDVVPSEEAQLRQLDEEIEVITSREYIESNLWATKALAVSPHAQDLAQKVRSQLRTLANNLEAIFSLPASELEVFVQAHAVAIGERNVARHTNLSDAAEHRLLDVESAFWLKSCCQWRREIFLLEETMSKVLQRAPVDRAGFVRKPEHHAFAHLFLALTPVMPRTSTYRKLRVVMEVWNLYRMDYEFDEDMAKNVVDNLVRRKKQGSKKKK